MSYLRPVMTNTQSTVQIKPVPTANPYHIEVVHGVDYYDFPITCHSGNYVDKGDIKIMVEMTVDEINKVAWAMSAFEEAENLGEPALIDIGIRIATTRVVTDEDDVVAVSYTKAVVTGDTFSLEITLDQGEGDDILRIDSLALGSDK